MKQKQIDEETRLIRAMEERYGCKFGNVCIHCLRSAEADEGEITDREIAKIHWP